MIGILYNKLQEMKQDTKNNPYTKAKKRILFRKKMLKQNLTKKRNDSNVNKTNRAERS
mgnify:CR=1 FL=1|jgi:hypothetical protein